MRSRDDLRRELLSLVVWWSLWSLWDTYLLAFTPIFECAFLGLVIGGVAVCGLLERRASAQRKQWSTAWIVTEAATAPDVGASAAAETAV